MKKILLGLIVFSLVSCQTSQERADEYTLVYLNDKKTGLCFVALNMNGQSFDGQTLTCVPCDSLKNFELATFNKK